MCKLKPFLCLLFLFLAAKSFAQNNQRDSLFNKLNTTEQSNEKGLLLIEISKTYRSTVPDSAFYFADSALRVSGKLSDKEIYSTALLSKGVAQLRQKKYADAEKTILDAKRFFVANANRFYVAECNKFLGNLYNEQGKYKEGEAFLIDALNELTTIRTNAGAKPLKEIDKSINATLHFRYLARFNQSDYKGALEILKTSEQLINQYKIKNSSLYNSFGGVYANMGNHDSSLYYFLKGIPIAQTNNDTEEELRYYNNIGFEYVKLGNYNKAIEYYTHGINKATALKQHRTLGILLENLGSVHEKQSDFAAALSNYLKALTILQQYGQPVEVASAYSLLGEYYINQKLPSEALAHFDSAQVILEKIKHKKRLAELYEKKGSIYVMQQNNAAAEKMYARSLQMRLELKNADDIAAAYYTLAVFYSNTTPDSAQVYYNRAIEFNSKTQNGLMYANCYYGLGNVAAAKNKFKDAEAWFKKAAAVADSLRLKKNLYENYIALSQVYEKLNNPQQALQYYKLYSNVKDSVYNETTSKQIAETETRYETEKKEKQIELLNKDNEIKTLDIKRQTLLRNSVMGGAVLLLIIGALVFNRYRTLQNQKQQAERIRISTDLHDEVGSTLSSISMVSSYAAEKIKLGNTTEVQKLVTEISETAMQTGDDMNDIIWALNPRNDSFESMVNRLHNYALRITQAKNITLHFTAAAALLKDNMPMDRRKNLFLICKEAVNNAVKYSECKNLTVQFSKKENLMAAYIHDDGIGFDTATNFDGNGLKNMQQRAHDEGAVFSIASSRDSGTEIKLEMKLR